MRKHLLFAIAIALLSVTMPVGAQGDLASIKALVDGGHFDRAKPAIDAWVGQHPNDAEALALQAQVRLVFKDLDGALVAAEKAVALAPKGAAIRYRLAEIVGEQTSSAGVLRQYGLARRFKREAEAVLTLDPNHVDAMAALMEYHVRAPGIVGGDTKVAQQLLAAIKRVNPCRGFLAEYRLLQLDKKTDSPEPYYVKAMAADPGYYPVKLSLARYYAGDAVKRYAEAERIAKDAWALGRDRSAPAALLVFIFAKQQRWTDVDAVLAEADKANPDGLLPHYQLAATLNQMNADLPRAEREIRKYLAVSAEPNAPDHGAARKILGEIQAKLKRTPSGA